jgi:hypothetical protein
MTNDTQLGAASAVQERSEDYTPFIGSYDGPPVNGMVSVTYSAWVRVLAELARMVPFVGDATAGAVLRKVRGSAGELLHRIEEEIMNGTIQPWSPLRLTQDAPVSPLSGSAAKIGVFPVTANPFQWRHLLAGLSAIAGLRLDHVVYLVIDDERSEERFLPREVRHAIARELLARFSPLLLYSPVSASPGNGGVDALFKLLQLNGQQPMAVHFLTGGAQGSAALPPDQLVDALSTAAGNRAEGYDSWMHPLSEVFFGQAERPAQNGSTIKVLGVDFPLPELTSAEFPTALMSGDNKEALATLPFTVFRQVRKLWAHTEAKRFSSART